MISYSPRMPRHNWRWIDRCIFALEILDHWYFGFLMTWIHSILRSHPKLLSNYPFITPSSKMYESYYYNSWSVIRFLSLIGYYQFAAIEPATEWRYWHYLVYYYYYGAIIFSQHPRWLLNSLLTWFGIIVTLLYLKY